MPSKTVLAALLVLAPALAGCAAPAALDAASLPGPAALPEPPSFLAPVLVDGTRAGGEPVIAVLRSGTLLVSAHPGYTHYHPSSPAHPGLELVAPTSLQSYLWRSTDGGATWTHVGLPAAPGGAGPRSAGLGTADPDLAVMRDGTVCLTDLEALASASVSCSVDDGATWTGNPVAGQRPNDRQWLASYGEELYFTTNYFTDHALLASTDRGLTWERRGDTLCGGDLVANPRTGALYAGCPTGVSVSVDGGRTFEDRPSADVETPLATTEPAVDAADRVWTAYAAADERTLTLVGTPDDGVTWPWKLDLTPYAAARATEATGSPEHLFVWPWVSAGSAGRVAVSWFGADAAGPSDEVAAGTPWNVYTAFVVGADTPTPDVAFVQVTPTPMHQGPICQDGTYCQVGSVQGDARSDRRLGDLFETTLDLDGNLLYAFADTVAEPDDVVGHPRFVRQVGGVKLLLAGDAPATQG